MSETAYDIRVELETGDGRKQEYSLDEVREIAMTLHRVHRKYDVAEQLYRLVLEHRPEDAQTMEFLGILLQQTGRRPEALAMMTEAAELAPDSASIWNNLANMRVYGDDAKGAGQAYRRAIELAPEEATIYCNLGSVQYLTDDIESARHNILRALELAPTFGHAWFRYGALLAKEKKEAEAAKALAQAVIHSSDHSLSGDIGFFLTTLGFNEEARQLYAKWAEDEPDNPVARHKLAALSGEAPERCEDRYVESLFDSFAGTFEAQLTRLEYRAPELVRTRIEALADGRDDLVILDGGCGTGWCGGFLREHARMLVGVDLSKGMLNLAKRGGKYDGLVAAELTAYLAQHPNRFDRIVVCDTLCYFGALEAFSAAAMAALTPGGALVATVEAMMPDDTAESYLLQVNGRFRHRPAYVRRCIEGAGGALTALDEEVLREENHEPVEGLVLTARRPV